MNHKLINFKKGEKKMPKLPEEELWSPRYGVGDIGVRGEGIGDFAYRSLYIDLELRFYTELLEDEEEPFATFDFTNNETALTEKGYPDHEAKEIAAAVDVIAKYINRKTRFNPKYDRFFKESPLKE